MFKVNVRYLYQRRLSYVKKLQKEQEIFYGDLQESCTIEDKETPAFPPAPIASLTTIL